MKFQRMLAALGAAVMMAGCGTTAQPMPEVTQAATVPAVTEAVREPEGFELGDIVWTLERWPDGQMHLARHAVVAHEGDAVIVTHAVSDSPEALRECLPAYIEDGAEVWRLDAGECYASEAEAQAVADELNRGG